jgi:hypothetical protein
LQNDLSSIALSQNLTGPNKRGFNFKLSLPPWRFPDRFFIGGFERTKKGSNHES